MKWLFLKKAGSITLCFTTLFVSLTGCTKVTKDKSYWVSNWENEQVWDEYDNDELLSPKNNDIDIPSKSTPPKNDNSSISSENSNKGQNSITVDPDDKPTVKNTANLMNPFSVKSDPAAEVLRDKVLYSKSKPVNVTGKVYYISYRGDDKNDGLSPQTPWKTLSKLSFAVQIGEGDAVLFERGGVYRGVSISCINGVYYGAYGEGDKPAMYGSSKNYAKTKWTKDSKKNVWIASGLFVDAGIVIFNHGEFAGNRVFDKAELMNNGDFFSEEGGKLYLYMDTDPAQKYTDIEIGTDSHIFSIPGNGHDITIDNFTIKYGGAMGVQASSGATNITVTNCEIGWLGGGLHSSGVRYGNGIEFWSQCKNIIVENNWIYQIYDSGFTHQGNNTSRFTVENLLFTNNLVEYCNFAAVEYWAPAENMHKMINIEYSNNILRFAGYGWGAKNQPAVLLYSTDNYNDCENFVIKNNILDTAVSRIIRCIHQSGKLPVMSGNTFIGKPGDRLGLFGDSATDTTFLMNDETQDLIRQEWNDPTAVIQFN